MAKIVLSFMDEARAALAERLAAEIAKRGMQLIITPPSRLAELVNEKISAFIACDEAAAENLATLKKQNLRLTCAGLYYAGDAPLSGMLDRTYDTMLAKRWTVGAGIGASGKSLVLTGERGIRPVARLEDLPEAFMQVLASRIDQKHNATRFEQVASLPGTIAADVEEILTAVRKWALWSLFPKYQSDDARYPGAEFGFVARRTEAGTLITGRGSNKEEPSIDDLALLRRMDGDGTLHVASTRLKASLNAPLAHHIFNTRRDISWIVHSHVMLPEGVDVENLSAPGTLKDWDAIHEAVESGTDIINQPLHGTLILLRDKDELAEILKRNNLYRHRSELYDLAYARFQGTDDKPTHFEQALRELNVAREARALDLCCGTGASTLALRKLGFTDTDFADGSPSMLKVAETRLGKKGMLAPLDDLAALEDGRYGLITMRQAFNYVTPGMRQDFLKNVHAKLQPGGQFAFNTFTMLPDGPTAARDNAHETENLLVRTRETNVITGAEVAHYQRSEVIDFARQRWAAVMDMNVFYQHAIADIEADMKEAGFGAVEMLQERSSLTFVAHKKEVVRPVPLPTFHNPQGPAR